MSEKIDDGGWYYNETGALSGTGFSINAGKIRSALEAAGWSINAIAGIMANMQVESGLNPGAWEGYRVGNLSGGFGLVQWTPATKFFDWQGEGYEVSGDNQMERILFEVANGLQYAKPKGEFREHTFRDFTISKKRPGYLAAEFMMAYERPLKQGWKQQIDRARIGEQWFKRLTGRSGGKWLPVGMLLLLSKKGLKQ